MSDEPRNPRSVWFIIAALLVFAFGFVSYLLVRPKRIDIALVGPPGTALKVGSIEDGVRKVQFVTTPTALNFTFHREFLFCVEEVGSRTGFTAQATGFINETIVTNPIDDKVWVHYRNYVIPKIWPTKDVHTLRGAFPDSLFR